ncbi:hypothetical protein ABBQ32_010895 [Trebouxia sp. C0010 RCD-2024]
MHLSTTPTSLVKYNATALRQDLPSHFISTRPAFRCSNWTHRCFWHLQSGIFSSPSDKRRAGRVHAAAGVPTNNAPATAAVPLLLAQSYFALQHPAVLNMRYSQAVKEFAEAAVTAYECGYAEDTLRQELARATEEPSTSDNVKTIDKEDCLLCVCMVWMTLTMAKSTRRWSTAKPVSEATLASWKGFVTLIVNGYMRQRLAWFPIDRLQMEITAVTGRTERPHNVAEWARIVHTTLAQVAPQFPSQ